MLMSDVWKAPKDGGWLLLETALGLERSVPFTTTSREGTELEIEFSRQWPIIESAIPMK